MRISSAWREVFRKKPGMSRVLIGFEEQRMPASRSSAAA